MMNSPIDLSLFFLANINSNATAPISMGRLNALVLSPRPKRVIIHAVTVVPMLAPIITATAPARLRRPAFTNETTITVVALEDWIAVVTAVPVRMPRTGLPVTLPMMERILLPANFCRPSLISFIPNRNTAKAPAKFRIMITISLNVIFSTVYVTISLFLTGCKDRTFSFYRCCVFVTTLLRFGYEQRSCTAKWLQKGLFAIFEQCLGQADFIAGAMEADAAFLVDHRHQGVLVFV